MCSHKSPSLIIIMILFSHQLICKLSILIILFESIIRRQVISSIGITEFKLNESDNSVVYDSHEFRKNRLSDKRNSRLFNRTDSISLDINLISYRLWSHDSPRCTVVMKFLRQDITTHIQCICKLFIRSLLLNRILC